MTASYESATLRSSPAQLPEAVGADVLMNHKGLESSVLGAIDRESSAVGMLASVVAPLGLMQAGVIPSSISAYACSAASGVVATAGANYVQWHKQSARRQQEATNNHRRQQLHFEQPLDVTEDRARWYGFDTGYHATETFNPLEAVDDFGRLIGKLAWSDIGYGVKEVAVSTDILKLLPDDKPETYGEVVPGNDYLHPKVKDQLSDPEVITMNFRQANKLYGVLYEAKHGGNVNQAMRLLKQAQPDHPTVRLFEETGLSGVLQIQKVIRARIEDRATDISLYVDKGADGKGYDRRKAYQRAVLKGEHFQMISEYRTSDGQAQTRPDGRTHVSKNQNSSALLKQASEAMAAGKKPVDQLETALWVSIEEFKRKQLVAAGDARYTSASVQARIHLEPPRSLPFLRKLSKHTASDGSRTLEYHSPSRKRALLSTAAAAVVLTAYFGGLYAVGNTDIGRQSSAGVAEAAATSPSSTSGIGDVDAKSGGNPGIWKIESTGGAEAEGYWSSQVANFIELTAAASAPVPPYSDRSMAVNYIASFDEYLSVPVEETEPSPDQPVLRLSAPASSVATEMTDDGTASGYILPVKQGGSIMQARIMVQSEDQENYALPSRLYLNADGTYLLFQQGGKGGYDPSQVWIEYSVDPAATRQPVAAVNQMMVYDDSRDDKSYISLQYALTTHDAARIAEALPGPLPDGPIETQELTALVKNAHSYSLTPLEDEKVNSREYAKGENALAEIGESIASLEKTNCNVAAIQELLMLRGIDHAGDPINPVIGFHAVKGAQYLSQLSRHMWLTDAKGAIIDSTPAGFIDIPITDQELQAQKEAEQQHEQQEIVEAGKALLLGAGFYIGVDMIRRRRIRKAAEIFHSKTLQSTGQGSAGADLESPEPAKAHEHLSLIQWLSYSSHDSTYDADRIRKDALKFAMVAPAARLKGVPRQNVAWLKQELKNRGIVLPRQERQELYKFAKQLSLES